MVLYLYSTWKLLTIFMVKICCNKLIWCNLCGIILTSDEKDLQGFKSALFIHSPGLAVVSCIWKRAAWGKHVMSCLYREG